MWWGKWISCFAFFPLKGTFPCLCVNACAHVHVFHIVCVCVCTVCIYVWSHSECVCLCGVMIRWGVESRTLHPSASEQLLKVRGRSCIGYRRSAFVWRSACWVHEFKKAAFSGGQAVNKWGVFRLYCITALRALNACVCVRAGGWVSTSVNISLSLDDGNWLHLKAIFFLDMHSVGQDPGAIYYIRLRHVQSADWEDSVPWPYLMKPGPHAAERFCRAAQWK